MLKSQSLPCYIRPVSDSRVLIVLASSKNRSSMLASFASPYGPSHDILVLIVLASSKDRPSMLAIYGPSHYILVLVVLASSKDRPSMLAGFALPYKDQFLIVGYLSY